MNAVWVLLMRLLDGECGCVWVGTSTHCLVVSMYYIIITLIPRTGKEYIPMLCLVPKDDLIEIKEIA